MSYRVLTQPTSDFDLFEVLDTFDTTIGTPAPDWVLEEFHAYYDADVIGEEN